MLDSQIFCKCHPGPGLPNQWWLDAGSWKRPLRTTLGFPGHVTHLSPVSVNIIPLEDKHDLKVEGSTGSKKMSCGLLWCGLNHSAALCSVLFTAGQTRGNPIKASALEPMHNWGPQTNSASPFSITTTIPRIQFASQRRPLLFPCCLAKSDQAPFYWPCWGHPRALPSASHLRVSTMAHSCQWPPCLPSSMQRKSRCFCPGRSLQIACYLLIIQSLLVSKSRHTTANSSPPSDDCPLVSSKSAHGWERSANTKHVVSPRLSMGSKPSYSLNSLSSSCAFGQQLVHLKPQFYFCIGYNNNITEIWALDIRMYWISYDYYILTMCLHVILYL